MNGFHFDPKKLNLVSVYNFFGGFAETITIVGLIAGITLAFFGKLSESFAAMITAIGGSSIAHDQLTQWNNRRDKDDSNVPPNPQA